MCRDTALTLLQKIFQLERIYSNNLRMNVVKKLTFNESFVPSVLPVGLDQDIG